MSKVKCDDFQHIVLLIVVFVLFVSFVFGLVPPSKTPTPPILIP